VAYTLLGTHEPASSRQSPIQTDAHARGSIPMRSIDDPLIPAELRAGIIEFWPEAEYDNAASIAWLESNWDAFALANTVTDTHPCGSVLRILDGIKITAERSIGYFQINSCNFPDWEWQRLYNARHNCGTAHMLWDQQGWAAWYYSAVELGIIHP